jgi:hypothetical protein
MSYKKGEVISVVTAAGEFVGKFSDESPARLTIDDPRMVIQTQEGMGFARGVCVTGKENPTVMSFYSGGIVFTAQSNDEIEKAYFQAVSGLIL